MPWRETADPYRILVSEVMLQQTQVSRVIPKYEEFLKAFPTAQALAAAAPSAVLRLWQGLGYNRRALNLKKAAETICDQKLGHKGRFPEDRDALIGLPGIGQSTAGAIMNFAFNKPTAFIETNIRAVFLYFFFKGSSSVSDTDIYALVEETIDSKRPREWFYALYDYGTMLKSTLGKERSALHKQSKHYSKQSAFKGSNRELRSSIVKHALAHPSKPLTAESLYKTLKASAHPLESVRKNLLALEKEGFIEKIPKRQAAWRLCR